MRFGGYIQDTINRQKHDREQRSARRAKFKGDNRETVHSADKNPERIEFITLPENQLNEIKKQTRERARAKRKRDLIIFGILLLISLIVLSWFVKWM